MYFVWDLIHDYPILSVFMLAFTVGMMVDAYRRGAEPFWYWLLWLMPVIGPLFYFFVHPGPELWSKLGPLFQPGVSLNELVHRVEQSPTLANRLALGQALIARKEYTDALSHLEPALKIEPDHGQVLYAIAVCMVRMDRAPEAIPYLERILAKDPRWGDDQAGVLMVEIHQDLGDHATALVKARQLIQLAPTLKHKCLLAEVLLQNGEAREARTMLERALQDHSFLPSPLRRRNRVWARQAKRILKRLA